MLSRFNRIRKSEKELVAFTSILAAIFLTVAKLFVGLHSGSLGILAEAAHSAMDLAAALITFLAVRAAARPPDSRHQFGHEKFENLSALFETLLLIGTCFWIGYEAINKLISGEIHISHSPFTYGIMLLSIIIDQGRSRALMRVARKYNSQALEADALHFRTDILSSSVVIIGLLGANFGFAYADPVAALGVSVFVLVTSIRLGKACVDALMDTAPHGSETRIRHVLEQFDENLKFRNLRVRTAGAKSFINLDLDVDRRLSFEEAHTVVHRVQDAIEEEIPFSDVVIHADPYQSEREKIIDTLRLQSKHLQLNIHHVSLIRIEKGYVVEFHLECDEHMSLEEAYHLTNKLKTLIYRDLENVKDINIHLEDLNHDFREGVDVSGKMEKQVAAVKTLAQKVDGVINCHDIVFLELDDGSRNLSLDCVFDGRLSIFDVHQLTNRVENEIRSAEPGLDKVIVHAEPLELIEKESDTA